MKGTFGFPTIGFVTNSIIFGVDMIIGKKIFQLLVKDLHKD